MPLSCILNICCFMNVGYCVIDAALSVESSLFAFPDPEVDFVTE